MAGFEIKDKSARGAGAEIDEEKLPDFFAAPSGDAYHALAKARLVTGVDEDEIGGGRVRHASNAGRSHRTLDRNRRTKRNRAG